MRKEMNDLVKVVKNKGRQTIDPGQNFQGMTVREIAELCRVDVRTIYRWVESLNDKMSLRNKLDEGSPKAPAKFTLEETLAIVLVCYA
jgi:transposase